MLDMLNIPERVEVPGGFMVIRFSTPGQGSAGIKASGFRVLCRALDAALVAPESQNRLLDHGPGVQA